MLKERLDADYIFTICDFFSPQECAAAISRSEAAGYDEATITTAMGMVMNKGVRDNARLICDDEGQAEMLWRRARPFLPAELDGCAALGFNERWRYYRYDVGQRFAPHYDGSFRRDNGQESKLTFMIYLNDDFTGGETTFYVSNGITRLTVAPQRGMALVFVHQQLHEGTPVVSGRKYVLRTDVMYASP
jgi:predicted 2-oxoglutarate/Fe(II)-dependent dioxygenase YbiX